MREARPAGRSNRGRSCSQRSWGAVSDWNAAVRGRGSRETDAGPRGLRRNSASRKCAGRRGRRGSCPRFWYGETSVSLPLRWVSDVWPMANAIRSRVRGWCASFDGGTDGRQHQRCSIRRIRAGGGRCEGVGKVKDALIRTPIAPWRAAGRVHDRSGPMVDVRSASLACLTRCVPWRQ